MGLNSHQVMARNDDVPMTQGNSDVNITHSFYNRLYAPTCGGDRRFETETADDLLQHCVAAGLRSQMRRDLHSIRVFDIDALQAPKAELTGARRL